MESIQQKNKVVNLKLIGDISKQTKISIEKMTGLVKVLRLRLDATATKSFLVILYTSDPESVVDAVYTYLEDVGKYDHDKSTVNKKRFLRYLLGSKRKAIPLDDLRPEELGVVDVVDNEISKDELDYVIEEMG